MTDPYMLAALASAACFIFAAALILAALCFLVWIATASLCRWVARAYRRRVHARTARTAMAGIDAEAFAWFAARVQPVPDTRRCPTCRGDMETCTCGTHPGHPHRTTGGPA